LYPVFIAAVYGLYGYKPLAIVIVQIVLDSVTAIFVFLIAKKAFSSISVALTAGLAYAFSPLAIAYSFSMYAECFFTFFLALSVFLFVSAMSRDGKGNIKMYAFSGLAIGSAALAKPFALYMPLLFILASLSCGGNLLKDAKAKAFNSAVFLIAFLIVISPWQLRNLAVYGHYALTYQQGRELLLWNVALCQSMTSGLNEHVVQAEMQEPFDKIEDLFLSSRAEGRYALGFIAGHSWQYAGCLSNGLAGTFLRPALFDLPPDVSIRIPGRFLGMISPDARTLCSHAYFLLSLVTYLFFMIGVGSGVSDRKTAPFTSLFALLIAYGALAAGVEGYFRYLAPLAPLILIVAVFGLYRSIIFCKRPYSSNDRRFF
jgi:4-amino-4-deoxy-L-arabinose transferase-like glycosyltransferase